MNIIIVWATLIMIFSLHSFCFLSHVFIFSKIHSDSQSPIVCEDGYGSYSPYSAMQDSFPHANRLSTVVESQKQLMVMFKDLTQRIGTLENTIRFNLQSRLWFWHFNLKWREDANFFCTYGEMLWACMIFYVISNILYTRDIPGFPLPYYILNHNNDRVIGGLGLPYYVECKCAIVAYFLEVACAYLFY